MQVTGRSPRPSREVKGHSAGTRGLVIPKVGNTDPLIRLVSTFQTLEPEVSNRHTGGLKEWPASSSFKTDTPGFLRERIGF